MKTIKSLVLLAVFCLTVSGSTYESQPNIDEILKVDKDDFKITDGVIKKHKKPGFGGRNSLSS